MRFQNYSRQAGEKILLAEEKASQSNHKEIYPEHLLLVFLEAKDSLLTQIFASKQLSLTRFQHQMEQNLATKQLQKTMSSVRFSKALQEVFQKAEKAGGELVKTQHLLESALSVVGVGTESKKIQETKEVSFSFGRELEASSIEGDIRCVGRQKELHQVLQTLTRSMRNNIAMIGETGVGKRNLTRELVHFLPLSGIKRRLFVLDESIILTSTKLRGELEKRFQELLDECEDAGPSILIIYDFQEWLREKSLAHQSFLRLLSQALERRTLQCIFTLSPTGWQQMEQEPRFRRFLHPVFLHEPKEEECLRILRGIKEKLEGHHQVRLSEGALLTSIKLSQRYLAERVLPEVAIDLLDEACSVVGLSMQARPLVLLSLQEELTELLVEKEKNQEDEKINARITACKERIVEIESQWEQERQEMASLQHLRKKKAIFEKELSQAKERRDFERVAEIQYESLLPVTKEVDAIFQKREERGKKAFLREDVSSEDIALLVAERTGIPVASMLADEKQKLLQMEQELSSRVIGQKDAVHVIANAVRRSRSGLADPGRPIGSFFFVGPTGVGKTELAKALADFLFDDHQQALLRFDMSEFMEKHHVARLVGAPPGYAGFDAGGELTEAVRAKPYSVVLFDEVEKAHPDIFHLFLQVLDDGHLTDSQGRRVGFQNTVIIFTSNLGAELVLKGQSPLEEIEKTFKPEFLNRIDDILTFQALREQDLLLILEIFFRNIQRLLKEQGLTSELDASAKKVILSKGSQLHLGARPLKRALQKLVQNPIASMLLQEDIPEGSHILIKGVNEELSFVVE